MEECGAETVVVGLAKRRGILCRAANCKREWPKRGDQALYAIIQKHGNLRTERRKGLRWGGKAEGVESAISAIVY